MEGESEYSFWHLLVRDVAYGQIPRAERVRRHRSAAAWIERKAGERAELDRTIVGLGRSLQVATIMSATGSFDHRAIDGADGARLMQAFKRLVENPLGMLA